MRTTAIIIFLLHYCLSAGTLPAPRFTVTHYGTRDGLGNNHIICLLQDKLGVLWAGTNFGLSRYDGYRWQNFRNTSTQALSESSVINCLLEDTKFNLWVGEQQNGLQYFKRQTFRWKSFKGELPKALPAKEVTSIARDSTGTTWFVTDIGLFYLAKDAVIFSKLELPADSIHTGKVICDRNGAVWVLSSTSLHRIEAGSHQMVKIVLPMDRGSYYWRSISIELDAGDGIILSRTGLALSQVFRVRSNGLLLRDDLPAQFVKIPSQQQDHFIITSDGQQWQLRQNLTATVDRLPVEKNDNRICVGIGIGWFVNCIIPDRTKGIWWMATTSGIHKIVSSRETIHAYTATELGNNNVRAVCEVGGKIVIGTTTALLEMNSDGVIRPLQYTYRGVDPRAKKREIFVGSFSKVSDDSLLIGTLGGIYLLTQHESVLTDVHPTTFRIDKSYIAEKGSIAAWGMAREKNGRYWIGTRYGGLFRFKDSDEKPTHDEHRLNDSTSLPGDAVWCISIDTKGRVWCGTSNGLALWNERSKSFKRYAATGSPNAICGSNIWSIIHTPDGTMWVGCLGAGISMYRENTDDFISFTRASGLPFESVCSIIPQGNDTLWISTYDAVFRFIPSNRSVLALHSEDGLHDDNFGLKVGYGARDGRLFFGGQTGLTMISNPEKIKCGVAPKILLTSVMIGDSALARDVITNTHLETTHDHNTLLFTYGIMDYLSPENNRIEYKLEGVDTDWIRDEGRGQVLYSALVPGTYHLRLRGTDSQGVRSKSELVTIIDIIPAWWQCWWFQPGIVFLFMTLFAGFVYQRRLQHLRFNKAVEKVRLRERRLLASDIHDGPLQDLYGLRFLLDGRNSISDEALSSVGNVTKKVRKELSSICNELRPVTHEEGLASAIRHLILFYETKHPAITFETSIAINEQRLGEEQHEAIFFVARTGMTNVIKHANASHVHIKLLDATHGASFELQDDGVGFIVPKALNVKRTEKQFGLDLCQEFAKACDGKFSVASTPGGGTTISLNVRKRKWWETVADKISRRM